MFAFRPVSFDYGFAEEPSYYSRCSRREMQQERLRQRELYRREMEARRYEEEMLQREIYRRELEARRREEIRYRDKLQRQRLARAYLNQFYGRCPSEDENEDENQTEDEDDSEMIVEDRKQPIHEEHVVGPWGKGVSVQTHKLKANMKRERAANTIWRAWCRFRDCKPYMNHVSVLKKLKEMETKLDKTIEENKAEKAKNADKAKLIITELVTRLLIQADEISAGSDAQLRQARKAFVTRCLQIIDEADSKAEEASEEEDTADNEQKRDTASSDSDSDSEMDESDSDHEGLEGTNIFDLGSEREDNNEDENEMETDNTMEQDSATSNSEKDSMDEWIEIDNEITK